MQHSVCLKNNTAISTFGRCSTASYTNLIIEGHFQNDSRLANDIFNNLDMMSDRQHTGGGAPHVIVLIMEE
jgi:hypothetical protein